jgi:DNA helicase MCM9
LGALWDMGQLQAYVAWVKRTLEPRLTAEGERVLVQYYKLQRGAAERSAARTTVRMLESLVRIAQAHARLMYARPVRRRWGGRWGHCVLAPHRVRR